MTTSTLYTISITDANNNLITPVLHIKEYEFTFTKNWYEANDKFKQFSTYEEEVSHDAIITINKYVFKNGIVSVCMTLTRLIEKGV